MYVCMYVYCKKECQKHQTVNQQKTKKLFQIRLNVSFPNTSCFTHLHLAVHLILQLQIIVYSAVSPFLVVPGERHRVSISTRTKLGLTIL